MFLQFICMFLHTYELYVCKNMPYVCIYVPFVDDCGSCFGLARFLCIKDVILCWCILFFSCDKESLGKQPTCCNRLTRALFVRCAKFRVLVTRGEKGDTCTSHGLWVVVSDEAGSLLWH